MTKAITQYIGICCGHDLLVKTVMESHDVDQFISTPQCVDSIVFPRSVVPIFLLLQEYLLDLITRFLFLLSYSRRLRLPHMRFRPKNVLQWKSFRALDPRMSLPCHYHVITMLIVMAGCFCHPRCCVCFCFSLPLSRSIFLSHGGRFYRVNGFL